MSIFLAMEGETLGVEQLAAVRAFLKVVSRADFSRLRIQLEVVYLDGTVADATGEDQGIKGFFQ